MIVTGKSENGNVITDINSWFRHGGPAKGAEQWKDYRSAKELAQAWLRFGVMRCPDEMTQLFSSRPETKRLKLKQAVAEMEIAFDDNPRGPRNADLAAWGEIEKTKHGVALNVEAKADEYFGNDLIGDKLKKASKTSGVPARIDLLSKAIFDQEVNEPISNLRYQLLPALAATAAFAHTKKANIGVLVVHEFISLTLDFDRVHKNADDLESFVRLIPGWENEELQTGVLLKPVVLKGNASIGENVPVTIGKIRTLIPMGSGGRIHCVPSGDRRQQAIVY